MPQIRQLDPHVADLIAAGEVVERPASVVKELMENAIDAGADAVTVEIQRGGMSYIRVTDDGCGIPADEVLTAFLRHATSKLRTEHDLEAIGTLGFRGEALAAISAVSRVEVMTRTKDAAAGTAVLLDGGSLRTREEIGCPTGTTMIVRDLFFNTPARLKFMKRDAAEGAAVFAAVQRQALAHPEVAVQFFRDGREELTTPGDGKPESALYAVLGRDTALGLLPCQGSGETLSVSGFVSRPVCCRGTRGGQFFFVNGRYVRSRTMQAALEAAYQNQKMVGKFPACVLFITTRLNAVDVNVHPAKTEVKFVNEKALFDGVYYAVLSALKEVSAPRAVLEPRAQTKVPAHDTVTPNQTFFRTMTAEQLRRERSAQATPVLPLRDAAQGSYSAPARPGAPAVSRVSYAQALAADQKPARPAETPAVESPGEPAASRVLPQERETPPDAETQAEPTRCPAAEPIAEIAAEDTPAPVLPSLSADAEPAPDTPDWRLAGEVLNTYIVVERGESVDFIDKHAAHERMNFDRLKAQDHRAMAQALLQPLVPRLSPEEQAVLLQHLPLLAEFGFAAEEFGGGSLIVREAPDYLPAEEIGNALGEIAAKLLTAGTADPSAARDEVLHTMACKAAIKGGWKNGTEELLAVCREVMSGAVKFCPHGRPVAIELTKKQLEKQFGRA